MKKYRAEGIERTSYCTDTMAGINSRLFCVTAKSKKKLAKKMKKAEQKSSGFVQWIERYSQRT